MEELKNEPLITRPLPAPVQGCEVYPWSVKPALGPAWTQMLLREYIEQIEGGVEFYPGSSSCLPWDTVCSKKGELALPTAYNCKAYATLMNMVALCVRSMLRQMKRYKRGRIVPGPLVVGGGAPDKKVCQDRDIYAGFLNVSHHVIEVDVAEPGGTQCTTVLVGSGEVFLHRGFVQVVRVRGGTTRLLFGFYLDKLCELVDEKELQFCIEKGTLPRFYNGDIPVPAKDIPGVVNPEVMTAGLYCSTDWVPDHGVQDSLTALFQPYPIHGGIDVTPV